MIMAMIKCPKCGKDISDKAKTCPGCGELIEGTIMSEEPEVNNINDSEINPDDLSNDTSNDVTNEGTEKGPIATIQKKKKKGLIIGIVIAFVVIASSIGGIIYYNKVVKPKNMYKEADSLLEDKKYAEAQEKFRELGDYKDSAEKIIECDYASASDALANEDYDSAKKEFEKIADYKDSADLAKECDYQKALDYYDAGDYKNAVGIFCNIFDYSDTKQYVYNVYSKLAGQDYIDKYTKGVEHLSKYIESQSRSLMTYVYSAYWGTNTEDSWSPDISDKDLNGMNSCMNDLKSMKKDYTDVFSDEVIEACNDETLTSANEKFEEVHKCASDMLKDDKVMTYIKDIVNGTTTTMENDTSKAAKAMSEYTTIFNGMKEK